MTPATAANRATSTSATLKMMGSPARGFVRRAPIPLPGPHRLTHGGRWAGTFERSVFARGIFECREPEGEPYRTGSTPPMSVRPALHRHPPATEVPAVHPPGVGPFSDSLPDSLPDSRRDPSRGYPVERAFLQADRIALSLRGALERTTIPLARAATALVAAKAWCDFGFARLDDYARERLGRSGRWVRDLAALGERLPSLPALAAAVTGEDGGRPIGRVAALLVARVASPESLEGWITRARAASIRALRDTVRAARAAPIPSAPAAASPAAMLATALAASPVGTSPPATHAAVPAAATATAPAAPSTSAAPDDDDDPADRLLVRMMVPSSILAAFDEALDLFRAVEGGEATIASFVDALIAEAAARGEADGDGDPAAIHGGAAPTPSLADADLRVLRAGPAVAALERALAASTENWRHLPEHVESSWALSLAGVTLARFRALAAEAGHGAAADLDRQLRALVELENELESRLGALLADLADRRAWPRLRFAGVGHYGEERLGLSRTTAEDRARLARDLRRYPHLREAYATGRLSREATALVARLLRDAPSDAAHEAAWVARAAESTVKRMRDEARALGRYRLFAPRASAVKATDAPAPAHPAAPTSVPGPTSTFAPAPAPLDDAAWHASLRREPGLARRRVRLFGRLAFTNPDVFQTRGGCQRPDVFQALPHETDVFLRLRLPLDLGHQFLAAVASERRRLAATADALPWDADTVPPDAPPSWRAARMFSIRCRRLPAWVGLLSLLEDFVDTWDDEHGMPRRPGDEIYIRDGWRCAAPGCTSRRNLEDHHIRYRSRGGDDEPANRVCLCRFHHQRGEHGGLASCRGRAPTGVIWRLGRKDAAPTWYRNERRIAG